MKKIIAFALTLILLCSISSAFAANVVGTHGDTGTVADGIDSFGTNNSTKVDVSVQVGTISHRYAVDVEYTISAIDLGDGFVWDVNALDYNITNAGVSIDQTFTVSVKNYSDRPVYLTTAYTDANNADQITFTAEELTGEKLEAVAPGAATPTQKDITLTAASTDWTAAAKYYAFNKDPGQHKIGTLTLTIAENA